MTKKEKENGRTNGGLTDNSITDLARLAIPYLLHGLSQSIEGWSIVRISIQRTGDSTYKGVINGVHDLDGTTESGHVAYTRADTPEEVLEYFEYCLMFGEMDWREDKYFKKTRKASKFSPQGKEKIILT